MPSLLSCSPRILDQSFPRDQSELNKVLITFGELQNLLENNSINIIITETLKDFLLEFNWENSNFTMLLELHRLLSQWMLQNNDNLIEIDTNTVKNYTVHQLPNTVSNNGLAEIWSDEMGKLLILHDEYIKPDFCIGIACENAFSGNEIGHYNTLGASNRVFPLIGPNNLNTLKNAFTWEIPHDLRLKSVTFDDAFTNCFALGATGVDTPKGGSHYKVNFSNNRSWALDCNHDSINDRFLKELVPITNFPFEVIKYVLLYGHFPRYYCFFKQ